MAEARSLDQGQDIGDRVEAARLNAKRPGLRREAENAVEIVIRAEQGNDEMLAEIEHQSRANIRFEKHITEKRALVT